MNEKISSLPTNKKSLSLGSLPQGTSLGKVKNQYLKSEYKQVLQNKVYDLEAQYNTKLNELERELKSTGKVTSDVDLIGKITIMPNVNKVMETMPDWLKKAFNIDFKTKTAPKTVTTPKTQQLLDEATDLKAQINEYQAIVNRQKVGLTEQIWDPIKAGGLGMTGRALLGTAQDLLGVQNATGYVNRVVPTTMEYEAQFTKAATESGVGKFAQDAALNLAYMMPTALVTLLTGNPNYGLAIMGLSTYETSYADAKFEGKTDEEAVSFGILQAAKEVGLGKLLGGATRIFGPSIGSKLMGQVISKVIPNQFAQTYVANMVSEFGEEYVQQVLDPVIRNITFNEKNKIDLFSYENLYAGALGGVTSVITGLPRLGVGLEVTRINKLQDDLTKVLSNPDQTMQEIMTGTSEIEVGDKLLEEISNISEKTKEAVKTYKEKPTTEAVPRLGKIDTEISNIDTRLTQLEADLAKYEKANKVVAAEDVKYEIDKLTAQKETLLKEQGQLKEVVKVQKQINKFKKSDLADLIQLAFTEAGYKVDYVKNLGSKGRVDHTNKIVELDIDNPDILFVKAHEIVHILEKRDNTFIPRMMKFIEDTYSKKTIDSLKNVIMKSYKISETDPNLNSEIVAHFMEQKAFTVNETLAKLYSLDKKTFNETKRAINNAYKYLLKFNDPMAGKMLDNIIKVRNLIKVVESRALRKETKQAKVKMPMQEKALPTKTEVPTKKGMSTDERIKFNIQQFAKQRNISFEQARDLYWAIERAKAKEGYKAQSAAVQQELINEELDRIEKSRIYADEGDLLNVILFKKTAAQWREENPTISKKYNQRDFASARKLEILSNMEELNERYILRGIPQNERMQLLTDYVQSQNRQNRQKINDELKKGKPVVVGEEGSFSNTVENSPVKPRKSRTQVKKQIEYNVTQMNEAELDAMLSTLAKSEMLPIKNKKEKLKKSQIQESRYIDYNLNEHIFIPTKTEEVIATLPEEINGGRAAGIIKQLAGMKEYEENGAMSFLTGKENQIIKRQDLMLYVKANKVALKSVLDISGGEAPYPMYENSYRQPGINTGYGMYRIILPEIVMRRAGLNDYYKQVHYPDANVLSVIRLDTRFKSDNESPVLFLGEVQSDIFQGQYNIKEERKIINERNITKKDFEGPYIFADDNTKIVFFIRHIDGMKIITDSYKDMIDNTFNKLSKQNQTALTKYFIELYSFPEESSMPDSPINLVRVISNVDRFIEMLDTEYGHTYKQNIIDILTELKTKYDIQRDKLINKLSNTEEVRNLKFGDNIEYRKTNVLKNYENWQAITMKTMIQYAIDNNYGYVAWPTGKQVNDVYSQDKKGIINNYDEQIPNVTNKILSKYNVKVGEIELLFDKKLKNEVPLATSDLFGLQTSELPKRYIQDVVDYFINIKNGKSKSGKILSYSDIDNMILTLKFEDFATELNLNGIEVSGIAMRYNTWLEENEPNYIKTTNKYHGFEITDEMRKVIGTKGQYMFSKNINWNVPLDASEFGYTNTYEIDPDDAATTFNIAKMEFNPKLKTFSNERMAQELKLDEVDFDNTRPFDFRRRAFTHPFRWASKFLYDKAAAIIDNRIMYPTLKHEAMNIRFKDVELNGLSKFGIKAASPESAAVQKYGQREYINRNGEVVPYELSDLKKEFPNNWQKIKETADYMTERYKVMFDTINKVRTYYGLKPYNAPDNYFMNFRRFNKAFEFLGMEKIVDPDFDLEYLDTQLNSETEHGKLTLKKKGERIEYDAIRGFEMFLDKAGVVIFHTEDVMKIRFLSNYIRNKYAEGRVITKNGQRVPMSKKHLQKYTDLLDDYADSISGKMNEQDYILYKIFGKRGTEIALYLKNRVGANYVGGNAATPLTQFVPIFQSFATSNKKQHFVRAFAEAAARVDGTGDNFNETNYLMITRKGKTVKLYKASAKVSGVKIPGLETMTDAGYYLMQKTDMFAAEVITKTFYYDYLARGYSKEKANQLSSVEASKLMAGRTVVELPLAFRSKLMGLITQFMLEKINEIDVWKDIFRTDYASLELNNLSATENVMKYNMQKRLLNFTVLLTITTMAGYFFRKTLGRDVLINPVGLLADIIENSVNENLTPAQKQLKNLELISRNVPFADVAFGGGRFPVLNIFPDIQAMTQSTSTFWEEVGQGVATVLPPFGGSQARKIATAVQAYTGGTYTNDEGKKVSYGGMDEAGVYTKTGGLKFPVKTDPLSVSKNLIFGINATEEAQQYYKNKYKPLTEKQTDYYFKVGLPIKDYRKYVKKINSFKGDGTYGSTKLQKLDYIYGLPIKDNQKEILEEYITRQTEE